MPFNKTGRKVDLKLTRSIEHYSVGVSVWLFDMKKIKILSVLLIFLILVIYLVNQNHIFIKKKIIYYLPSNVSTFLRIVTNSDGNLFSRYNNDYKVKFLPNTQFNKLEFKKIKFNFVKKESFGNYPLAIDIFDQNLLITNKQGELYYKNIDDLENEKKKFTQINTNLDIIESGNEFLDTPEIYINENNIYMLLATNINNCREVKLYKGLVNLQKINFEFLFSTKKNYGCMGEKNNAGRIQSIMIDNEKHILISITSNVKKIKDISHKNSLGLLILFNENTKNDEIYAEGLRAVLGLYVDDEVVLATDNGPRGGDEINKIIRNKHYGWPIASYGEPYTDDLIKMNKKKNIPVYKKDHASNGFEEPIYSFVYALGIAEIIKLPNTFSKMWTDNFLVSTLNGHHLLRIKFDKDYKKIIYNEKIFIGERIRDLKYDAKNEKIILALTSTGSLGVLSNN